MLIQSEGENFRAARNGPLSTYGAWVLLGMIAVLALFFALRGRIKLHFPLALVFLVFWTGTLITGVFFLPYKP